MITGPRTGTNYLLDPAAINALGRGIDCDVVLSDPLCSRVHAELEFANQSWWLHDAGSRNGTFVKRQSRGKTASGIGRDRAAGLD